MIKKITNAFIILLLFTACSSPVVEKHHSFPGNIWKHFENPLINLDITQPGIFYNLYVVAEYDKATAPDFIPTSCCGICVSARSVKPNL